jgi:chromate transporter
LCDAAWRRTVLAGLMPVTAGLIMGAALLARTASAGWDTAGLTVAAVLLSLFTRLHPLLGLGAAAAPGALGVVRQHGATADRLSFCMKTSSLLQPYSG